MAKTRGAKDTKKRKGRRTMTEDEKVEQQRKAKATKDRKKQKEKERTARARPAANFFNPHGSQQPPTATTWEVDSNNNANSNSADSDDVLVGQVDGAANEEEHDGEEQKNNDEDEQNQSDDEVVIIDSASPRFVTPKDVGATLDVEDDEDDWGGDDDDDDEDGDNTTKQAGKEGVMRQVLRAVQVRIKYEESDAFPALGTKRMLEYLKSHNWCISRCDVPMIAKKLKLDHNIPLFKYYYTKLVVWMPHLQFGHMPCCINCKDNNKVGVPGYPSHPGRMVVDLKENYFIMGCRYKCNQCKKDKERLNAIAKAAAATAAAATAGADVEVEVTKINLQYTFIGWDSRVLPRIPRLFNETSRC